ncbi:unnamed protein product [Albugo candida]|uniref:Uncharacterized protein n=1 Tax=Albugo candida TaxID=65357 RepID=A0A024GM44_9STRA|nr:unnamed protein product [Albugo candida]|eukprot:CCI47606.1 unnamed protein product [Albugo candida]
MRRVSLSLVCLTQTRIMLFDLDRSMPLVKSRSKYLHKLALLFCQSKLIHRFA